MPSAEHVAGVGDRQLEVAFFGQTERTSSGLGNSRGWEKYGAIQMMEALPLMGAGVLGDGAGSLQGGTLVSIISELRPS